MNICGTEGVSRCFIQNEWNLAYNYKELILRKKDKEHSFVL